MTFDELFIKATGIHEGPFPYQREFAVAPELPQLVRAPTGLGKTAMAILGWGYRRRFADPAVQAATPRRLVYCLPMRVLVEQTRSEAIRWLHGLDLLAGGVQIDAMGTPLPDSYQPPSVLAKQDDGIAVHILMGGEQSEDWDLHPMSDAVFIGTQDMLLSRALNRGYGMSRYRWPVHFGLLNNDCVWVFDEVQLMDVGAATSAQLQAFRRQFVTSESVHCVWMSATLESDWLDTVDFDTAWLGQPLELTNEDKQLKPVEDRHEAVKPLERATPTMTQSDAVAKVVLEAHQTGSRTIGVFNTVDRAVDVYDAIKKQSSLEPVLIHSRFRPFDRQEKMQQLLADPPAEGTIAIATQVVEAGVDVSAKTLLTDLAPWASLVQRFGRCNRRGEFNKTRDARVHWIDWMSREQFKSQHIEQQQSKGKKTPKEDDVDQKYADYLDGIAKPYSMEELRSAREHLAKLDDVGPVSLESVKAKMELEVAHVIRRRDFLDLFDTTPDLAGNDIDVSRFIRSGEELDVQVFWRDVPADAKAPDPSQEHGKAPRREELCSVPAWQFRDFAKKKRGDVWRWNSLDRKWSQPEPNDIYPGQTFFIRSEAGGYDSDVGWNPKSKTTVEPIAIDEFRESEAYDGDAESAIPRVWQTIAEHSDDVVQQLESLLPAFSLSDEDRGLMLEVARWHDLGKAHPVFQDAIEAILEEAGRSPELRPTAFADRTDVAKAPDDFWQSYERRHFRHELASALAMLQAGIDDLAVYLAAAHHGKVRLSIRSLPGEKTPDGDASRLYARGIWDGDELPEVDLGGGVKAEPAKLSLECMQLGRSEDGKPSWVERMLNLRDRLGPFRLAYLEALFRAADMRASRLAERRVAEQQEVLQ